MIPQELIEAAQQQAYSDSELGAPSRFHIDYAEGVGKQLAKELGANVEIVTLGCYFMDCMLGRALSEGRLSEHVSMSHDKAKEILKSFEEVTEEEQQNVLHCVLEHHKVDTFYSLESEICCNADCYRFASVKGFIGGIHDSRSMPIDEMIQLYASKADEKWNNITLDTVREELESEYNVIKQLLEQTL